MNKLQAMLAGIGVISGGVFFMDQATGDDSGQIVEAGNIDVFTLQVGDCFDDGNLGEGESAEVIGVSGVPCTSPHDNELYALTRLELDGFPGNEQIAVLASDFCYAEFEDFVGEPYETSILDITYLYPSADSWSIHDDREVSCAVYDMNGEKLVGSVQGLGI